MLDSPKKIDNLDHQSGIDTREKADSQSKTPQQAEIDAAMQDIGHTMSPLTQVAEFTDVVKTPSIGATVTYYVAGKGYPAKVTHIEESDQGPIITVEADATYPGTNKKSTYTLEQFNQLPGGKKTIEAIPANKVPEKIIDTQVPDAILDNINDLVVQETLTRFDGKEIPQSIIDGQLVLVRNELTEAGHADAYGNVAQEVSSIFAEHNTDIAAKNAKPAAVEKATQAVEKNQLGLAEALAQTQTSIKALIDQYPTVEIPADKSRQLVDSIIADYKTKTSMDIIAVLQERVIDEISDHNKKVIKLESEAKNKASEKGREARASALAEHLKAHPDLEGAIAVLEKKVQAILQSKEWTNDTQLDPLQQISAANSPVTAYLKVLDEAQNLPGMTPAILEVLQKKWGQEINRQAELAPHLIKLSGLINSQLAKTETLIDKQGLHEIALAIRAIPRISDKQKELLLARASKQVVAHNDAVEAIQSARGALENQIQSGTVDRTAALAAIDQIANLSDDEREKLKTNFNGIINTFESNAKSVTRMPPPLPSQANAIEVDGPELEAVPEEAISDPDFNRKVDDLDVAASKLLQSMSNSSTNAPIDTDLLTNLLVEELKKQNLKTDSKEAIAWLSTQQETAHQINQGIESLNQEKEAQRKALEQLNQENERIREVTKKCHEDIDALLASPDCSTLEEVAAIQDQINTLPDSPEKNDLQQRVAEIEAHDQAVLQADALIQTALTSKVEISLDDLQIAIGGLLPHAGEAYWKAAQELIQEHNTQILSVTQPETATEDQAKIDALVNECNDKVSELLISGEHASIADIATLQLKIDSISDEETRTGLQKHILELQEYNQALKQADTLIETALATKATIDSTELKKNLAQLIPTAIEHYWNAAEEIIDEHNVAIATPQTTPSDQTPSAPVTTVADAPVVTPSQVADTPIQTSPDFVPPTTTTTVVGTPTDTLPQIPDAPNAQAPDTVINTAPGTLDPTSPIPASGVSDTPIVGPTVTPDQAPQADVLGVAPADTKVTAPVDVLNKVDATPLSPEQIAKRDEMFGLIEKNLILTEEEKGRMMVKVMELLRTASRGTNVMAELQKLMTSQDRHQEIQHQLNEKSPIFAMIVQDAVQSSLNTNDLDYKANEAAYQKMLSDLPTETARKAMQAIYNEAISNKKLRGDLKAIQARVEQVLTNQANFSDARNDSLEPLFKRMNVIIKTGLPRESQVLGSQTIAPDVSQWEAPQTDEQPESLRAKTKRKFLELIDRIRGKKAETTEAQTDTTNDLDEAYVKTPTEIVDFLIEGNADLTTAEKVELKATALELLEKGTDISKTVEKLKTTLTERSRINREISALVLDAPKLSRQMYSALIAAFDENTSPAKRTEALAEWQSLVDQLPTDRAKAVVKTVYQEALRNKDLRTNVNALEEKIADKLANTGIDDREKALSSLINTLGNEINRAISNRKPSDTVSDQTPDVAKASIAATAEVLASAPKTTVENKDEKLNQALNDRIIARNLNNEGKKRDITPQEFFGSDMDQLIKTMESENDQNLNAELKAIRQLLVDTKPGVMIGTEAIDRLTTALKAKYPEVLDTIMGYINIHIQEHDVRTAMQAEINAKKAELSAKIDTLSPSDISAEIKALHQKFASRINPFGVDQALVPLNDSLLERAHTNAAVKAIDELWKTEPTLALDKVAAILSKNQLDQTLMTRLVAFAKNIAPIINVATDEKRPISATERGKIISDLIPYMSVPQELKSALVTKVNTMLNDFNKKSGPDNQQMAA